MELVFLTTQTNMSVEMQYIPKVNQKVTKGIFEIEKVLVKSVTAKGNRMSTKEIKKVVVIKKAVSAEKVGASK